MMQEYKDLVIQAKNDSKYMQSLLCIMEPLVKSYAKKIFFLDWDDATQELNLAIIEAVKTIGDYIKLYEDMHLNSQVYDDFNVAYLISEASS